MQEQEPVQVQQKKTRSNLIFAAVLAAVIVAAAAVAYSIFDRSYNASLSKLKDMTAAANTAYSAGDGTEGATAQDQCKFYTDLSGQVGNLGQILQKLNARYPLLLGKGSEKSLGISALKEKMDAMSPKLDVLKACLDDDAAISARLAEILGRGAAAGQSAEYTDLVSRNNSLSTRLSGIAFEGPIEDDRAALGAAASARAKVLAYLVDDAAISEELAALMADTQTAPADLKAKFGELLQKNDALASEAEGVDLTGYGSSGVNIPQMISDRKALINACVGYMGELEAVQSGVVAFSSDLDINAAKPGKLSEKIAAYDTWMKKLKELHGQLDAVNQKDLYKGIDPKRDIGTLGMSPAGQKLLEYENALNALIAGAASSKDIEKNIDTLLAEKKMDLPDKTNALIDLDKKNDTIIASLAVEVPEDLKAGLANFLSACNERSKFLDDFMSYVEDQQIAAGCSATSSTYSQMRKNDLKQASYWAAQPGHEADVKYWNDQAALHQKLAGEQTTLKNAANKNAAAHKKDYEASRAKYVPQLDS